MNSTLPPMFGGSTEVSMSNLNAIFSNTGTGNITNITNITTQSPASKRLQDFGSLLDYVATEALHNYSEASDAPKCPPGTRIAFLDAIYHWAAASEYIIRIQWIYGPEGSGKSTLLRTLAEMLEQHGLLLAAFFFYRANCRNIVDLFIPTIIYQITRSIPNIRPHVERAIKEDPLILSQSLEAQARALIVLPITQAHRENDIGKQHPRIIIVDGLDEHKGEANLQQEVLRVLNQISKVPIPIAILIASRPETHILAIFDSELGKSSTRRLALKDFAEAEEDIRTDGNFCNVCGRHLVCSERPGLPSPNSWITASLKEAPSRPTELAAPVLSAPPPHSSSWNTAGPNSALPDVNPTSEKEITHPQPPAALPGEHSAERLKDNSKAGWAPIQVSTNLLWYLRDLPQQSLRTGGIMSGISNYIWGSIPSSPPKSEPVTNFETRLFALIIGINEYSDLSVGELRGAVADANEMEKYLKEKLAVPDSHITKLLDKQASRANIIQGFRGFIDNTNSAAQVQRGDAILIYFAGYGHLVPAPTGWPSWRKDNQIECIVPHDLCRIESKSIDVIPDATLGALIDGIASKWGNNITVIFDSCHSGSATRDNTPDILYRRVVLENYSIRPDLDQKLLSQLGVTGDLNRVPPSIGQGQESHMLLAACGSDELAREQRGHGQFTAALLKLLYKTSPDQITYADVLDLLDDISGQNPQLRGNNPNRILFNSKATHINRHCHRISFNSETGRYELAAGAAHGICKDDEFEIFPNVVSIPQGSGLGIVVVERVEAFHSILIGKNQANLHINSPAIAIQVGGGEEELKLHLELDEHLRPVFDAIQKQIAAGLNTRRLALVDRSVADLEIVPEGDKLAFKILDKAVTEYGLSRLSGVVERNVEDIVPVLEAAAHYYTFLKQYRVGEFIRTKINIQFLRLEYSQQLTDSSTGGRLKVPVGKNLIKDDTIILDIENEEDMYGIKITNESRDRLYVNVFYFDNSDLSIQSYYESGSGGSGFCKEESLRPQGGELTIGYGPGGGQALVFSVPEGRDVDVGFLKLFLSTSPVDLCAVPQISPFESSRKARRKKEESFVDWDTILIPLIQRRPNLKAVENE